MNERDIFIAAIEITDPAHRADYVAQACGADAGLRAQVEELLKAHIQASRFLETPAAASDSSVAQTIFTSMPDADNESFFERASGEAEFRKYLQPPTRPGSLGRLAHYEVEAIVGRGAFGIVAKAFDEKLQRVVAIKLMSPELASTSPPRKRFLREARTAASVTHENIVAIYAVEEEPIPYLVMEYIPGRTLKQFMDAKGPLEVQEVLRFGQQIAAGLAAAHAVNLIHRDIKPSNILLTGGANDRAKISDFGLARAVDDATMTSSGMITGTPMYMAPEQARGETLDVRADLFSLGSVLYQMASGRPPFRAANTVAVLRRVCDDAPRPLDDVIPGIPGWLETIIFKLLAKKREERYQTAQEVADLLARCERELRHYGKVTCLEENSNTAETQVLRRTTGTLLASRKKLVGWLVGGVMALVAVVGLLLNNGGRKTQTDRPAIQPAPAYVDSDGQAAVDEPPPLEEWLRGRNILTVAQDGSGQFKTIQAALDKLKPGEAVKVLDKGPYRESLRLINPPADIGLISDQQATLEIPSWEIRIYKETIPPSEHRLGHQIYSARGFRLSGFRMLATTDASQHPHRMLLFNASNDVVVEDCSFTYLDAQKTLHFTIETVAFNGFGPDVNRFSVVRDCVSDGKLTVSCWTNAIAAPVLLIRNLIRPWPGEAGILVQGWVRKVLLRQNVIVASPPSMGVQFLVSPDNKSLEMIDVADNSIVGVGLNAFHHSAPAGDVRIQANVLSSFRLMEGAEKNREVIGRWQVARNRYHVRPESLPESKDHVFRRPDDPMIEPEFLSEDSAHRDFARVAVVEGVAPAGALPPGPAPADGDWFTRLRERWEK